MKIRKLLFQDKIFILASFLLCGVCNGQGIANYVSNGGFEAHYTCTASVISIAKGWRSIDSVSGGALYYNACTPTSPVPWDGASYQYPRSGLAFGVTGFLCEPPQCNPNYDRGYFRNRLKSNLLAGKTYCVKFYANIRDNSSYGIDGFGAFFADNSIDTITKCTIPLTYINPQVQNPNGNIITDTMNWVLITGTFVANGTEKHLVIGNFKSDGATNKVLINPAILPTIGCDVNIDDVSCIATDLPAYAGPNMYIIPGNTVYIGRQQDVGIDEACTWYNMTNTTTPIAIAAGITVSPTITSTYLVKQDICGNVKWDTVTVYMSGVGLQELKMKNDDLRIFPNPADHFLNIRYTMEGLDKEFTKAEILNGIGRFIREVNLNFSDKQTKIDLQELPTGLYLIKLKGDEAQVISKRFTISK